MMQNLTLCVKHFMKQSSSSEAQIDRKYPECFGNWNCIAVSVFHIYRVSQEECTKLRESVPYVKLYRYNPKHVYPKLNGYGDNGQRSLKLWQLLLTYWLPNKYWNWQEYVVSVMLISVLNIKLTCELHKAIKLNYKNTRTHVIVVLRVPSTMHDTWLSSTNVTRLITSSPWRKYICGLWLTWAEFPSYDTTLNDVT